MAIPNWGGSITGERPSMAVGNMSGILPDESANFLTDGEHESMFGTGNIGPDRIRMSTRKVIKD